MATLAKPEDRFPLLVVLNVPGGDVPSATEKPLQASIRDRNVTRGVAAVLSRWPNHVSTSSRLALYTAVVVMTLILATITLFYYTSDVYFFPDDAWFRRRGASTPEKNYGLCDTETRRHHELSDVGDINTLMKYMAPFNAAVNFYHQEDKIFFVMSELDPMTPERLCALHSAARNNVNTPIFLLIFSEDLSHRRNANEDKPFGADKTFHVIYVNSEEYFKYTPLNTYWTTNNSISDEGLKLLAAKVVTLWRFGGLALDLNTISLKPFVMTKSREKSASADCKGRVIAARRPCHAFLFEMMKSMNMLMAEHRESYAPCNAVRMAQGTFCRYTRPCHFNRKCHGFTLLSGSEVCKGEPGEGTSCTWVTYDNDAGKKFISDVCARFAFDTVQ